MKKIFPAVAIILLLTSCHKDHVATYKTLITGKWIGVNSIRKSSTTLNNNTTPQYDTLDWSKPGYQSSLEFAVDKVSVVYIKPGLTHEYNGGAYSINDNTLNFMLNPFSFHSTDPQFGLFNNGTNYRADCSYISLLNSTRLSLYDIDTINFNPLIVWERWDNFIK